MYFPGSVRRRYYERLAAQCGGLYARTQNIQNRLAYHISQSSLRAPALRTSNVEVPVCARARTACEGSVSSCHTVTGITLHSMSTATAKRCVAAGISSLVNYAHIKAAAEVSLVRRVPYTYGGYRRHHHANIYVSRYGGGTSSFTTFNASMRPCIKTFPGVVT